ncbi:MAG: large-conductance mechanosensitive channel protein [Methylotenera sp. 24-45-7]|nr:MAG: large-conductance mechanosensitive channel protein [Methylotenera sp. 24-45-7]OZA54073.1 MAG: large-conductance mechanosensitive channel protein [Methylophilales bacterium 39-45-7]HQS37234.1 large conductance mechanosensitive channel protein MscL [Methylotenera sp.]HQS42883.1 large conductance mechanosensitive channel protein MscL [Methylotenera sp.]
MSIASEFKSFALRGNVMDLAVGVIIGAAFGKIVDSLVGDVIMPLIGRIIGNVDFSNMFIALADIPADNPGTYVALKAAGVPMLAYGNFLTIVINFVILAFVIFMLVKQMNRMKKAEPAPPAPPTAEDVLLLREIRDALKK